MKTDWMAIWFLLDIPIVATLVIFGQDITATVFLITSIVLAVVLRQMEVL